MSFARVLRLPVFRAAARAIGAAAIACALPLSSAHAAQILVYSIHDTLSTADGCSLREAIINANTDSREGSLECARGSGADVIILPPATLTLTGNLVDESSAAAGDLDITSDITLLGGSGAYTIIDANNTGRIFDVHAGGSLTLNGLRLRRGFANDAGGAIRVNTGGSLTADYLVVNEAQTSTAAEHAGAMGAGLYVGGAGSSATITRSEFGDNKSSGLDGRGAAIACDTGCTLHLATSSLMNNTATSAGAGLYVASGASASLSFVSAGYNQSLDGSAVYVAGTLQMFGSLLADNGFGSTASGDMACTLDSSVSVTKTFVEYPASGCPLLGMTERSMLPAGLVSTVFYAASYTSYEGAPGRILGLREAFYPWIDAQVPWSDARCSTLLDQHGRARVPGAACNLGAFQQPLLSVWKMGVTMNATDTPPQLYMNMHRRSALDTRVLVRSVTGVGESCGAIGGPVDTDGDLVADTTGLVVTIPAGEWLAVFPVDGAAMFPAPALNRPQRVCHYEAVVIGGEYTGATAGDLRARVTAQSMTGFGFSNPAVGSYLNIGPVPRLTGGQNSVLLVPDTGGFNVTGVSFVGLDADRFAVLSPAASESAPGSGVFTYNTPVPVRSRIEGGTALPIHCRPGPLGDYESEMVVYTDHPSWPALSYGVRCTIAHVLTLSSLPPRVFENVGEPLALTLSLDSPSSLAEPFSVRVSEVAGSATSGVDFSAFADVVTFAPGEQHKTLSIDIVNDEDVEEAETFGVRMGLEAPVPPYVRISGASAYTVNIDSEDRLSRQVSVSISGVPEVVGPGVLLDIMVTMVNTGNATLTGANVELSVEQPMWIRSFAVFGATCSIDTGKRKARCGVPFNLAPGESATVYGKLLTAEMNEAPTLDVRGKVMAHVTASDGEIGGGTEASTTVGLLIDAPSISTSLGGASWPGVYGMLGLVSLLAWRRRSRVVGWKARRR